MNDREKQSDETMKELVKEIDLLSRQTLGLASIVRTLVEGMVRNHTRKHIFARMLMNYELTVLSGREGSAPETTENLLKQIHSNQLNLWSEVGNLLPYMKCDRCGKELLPPKIEYSEIEDLVFCPECWREYLNELDQHPCW
jgi:DNA-directed RNA polymerase subunit RPC12/RpoP